MKHPKSKSLLTKLEAKPNQLLIVLKEKQNKGRKLIKKTVQMREGHQSDKEHVDNRGCDNNHSICVRQQCTHGRACAKESEM